MLYEISELEHIGVNRTILLTPILFGGGTLVCGIFVTFAGVFSGFYLQIVGSLNIFSSLWLITGIKNKQLFPVLSLSVITQVVWILELLNLESPFYLSLIPLPFIVVIGWYIVHIMTLRKQITSKVNDCKKNE